jgi:hypothetical protein
MTNRQRAHDPPAHHRSGGAVCGSAPPASRVLRIAGATASGGPGPRSLYRPCARITTEQVTTCPDPRAARAHPEPGQPWTTQPPTFSSPNVNHHLGLKRQVSGGTRHQRRGEGQKRRLLVTRQTRVPKPDDQRGRLQHRRPDSGTSSGCTGCAGSWKPPCSKPWQTSTTRRCRRWRLATRPKVQTPHGPRTRFQVSIERAGRTPLVVWFGGIPLKRQKHAVLTDRQHTGPIYANKQLVHPAAQGQMGADHD